MSVQFVAKTNGDFLITGETYPHRQAIKALGAKWDPRLGGWSVPFAKQVEMQTVVNAINDGTLEAPKGPGQSSSVIGRAAYKGRLYYMAADTTFGALPRLSADRRRYLLYSLDGKFEFWGDRDLVQEVKVYRRSLTIGEIEAFRLGQRTAAGPTRPSPAEVIAQVTAPQNARSEEHHPW